MSVRANSAKRFLASAGPVNDKPINLPSGGDSKVDPFTRLSQVPVAGAQLLDQRAVSWAFEDQFDTRANRVTVAGDSLESHRDEVTIVLGVVAKKTNTWSRAIGDPKIEPAIEIPIDNRHGPRVVQEIQLGRRRNVGELATAYIEETAVSLVPAKAAPLGDHAAQRSPTLLVASNPVGGGAGRFRRLRHDLSPEETSQIARVLGRDEAVRYVEILQ